MLSQELKVKAGESVKRVADDFEFFFDTKPHPDFLGDGMRLYFEVKDEFSRSVDLNGFEEIMERMMWALNYEFGKHDVPLKFWSCSSTDMEWEEK